MCALVSAANTPVVTAHGGAIGQVDGDALNNQHPSKQSEEDSEFITVDTIPLNGLYDHLQQLEKKGFGVWVGLWAIAQGVRLNQLIGADVQG